jgi:benzoyl-CoA reductase/2-hydroxyglutaryl-CoA dehydratase subunit BcrC/BadD/HgdB
MAQKEVQRIQTLRQLKEINFFYYVGLKQGKEKGVPIVYMNALAPIELGYALDLLPAYPENHAVAIQAKKMAVPTAEAAEAQGYTPDICSYIRCDLGFRTTGLSPIGGLPEPDLVLYCSAQCWAIGKWFEDLARRHHAPFFAIDVPVAGRGFDREPEQYAVEYVAGQLEECIAWLERHTGRKLDWEKLKQTVELSREASRLWFLILEAGTRKPSPLTLFDQYMAMAPMVNQRGTQVPVDFYRNLLVELSERVKQGIGGIPEEKYRLYWDGLPLWHSVADFYTLLLERGMNLVANNYTRTWAQLTPAPDDILRSWARNYLKYFDPMVLFRAWDIANYIQHFKLDGFILHSDHSCRFLSLGLMDTLNQVTKMTGMPGLLLDTDHGDPRLYQPEQIRTRIDAYLETLTP